MKYRVKQTGKYEFFLQRKRFWFTFWRTYYEDDGYKILCRSLDEATQKLTKIIEHEANYPKYHEVR